MEGRSSADRRGGRYHVILCVVIGEMTLSTCLLCRLLTQDENQSTIKIGWYGLTYHQCMCDLNSLVYKYIKPVDVTHTNIVRMELAVCYVNTYIQLSVVFCNAYTVFP